MDAQQHKNKVLGYLLKHKLLIIILIAAMAAAGYYYKSKNSAAAEISYIFGKTKKGTIITSVSGSGQVSASKQVEIKPKAAGEITNIAVKAGQEVKEGDLIAQIDSRDAQKTVKDAQTALETAQLDLNKLTAAPDQLSLMQAESALKNAQENLAELKNPDQAAIAQAENALTSAKDTLAKLQSSQPNDYQDAANAKRKADDDLNKAYEDAFNDIASAFLDLPTLVTGTRDAIYSEEIARSEITETSGSWNIFVLKNSIISDMPSANEKMDQFISDAESKYKTTKEKYDKNFDDYKDTSRGSDKNAVKALLNETLETVKDVSDAIKSESNMFDYWVDFRSSHDLAVYGKITSYQTTLNSYTSKTNSHLSLLLAIQKTIKDGADAIAKAQQALDELKQNQPLDLAAAQRSTREKQDALNNLKNPKQSDIGAAQRTVDEKKQALADLKAGADNFDIRAKKIAISEKQAALADAREKLADYEIRAPFDGIIADVPAQKGDEGSSGSAIATLITKQQIAEVFLNEVDAAKVKPEQKATITFNAIDGLSITGEVAEVGSIGAVSQGVVSYSVKIAFDTQDERIRPQMSASAIITINQKSDVLIIPNSAVKTDDSGASYVETISAAGARTNGSASISKSAPERKIVEIGLSNDTDTEILSGLAEGDQIIIKTNTVNTAQTQPSGGLNMLGGGSAFRMMGR